MLVHLQIRDLAVIDAAEIELKGGLTALTGETGAGKSIIVDAVMLALGGRASADALRHGAERAEITATFEAGANPAVKRWLDEQSIEQDDGEVVLRRVIGRDGRSRQYVNGQSLPAQSVRELGELLIDIHGQQEFVSLVSRDAQREIVDAHGVAPRLAADVAALAAEWRLCRTERDSLAAAAADRGARLELLRYQVGELEALALGPGEAESLAEERNRLANRGRLAEAVRAPSRSATRVTAPTRTRSPRVRRASCAAPRRSTRASGSRSHGWRNRSSRFGEAGAGLGTYLEGLDADPARQELVERRVAAIDDLARKHRVAGSALPAKLDELRAMLADIERSETALGGLDERISGLRTRYDAAASELGAARRSVGAQARPCRHRPHAAARHARRTIRDRHRIRCGGGTAGRGRGPHRVPGERESGRAGQAGVTGGLGRGTVAHQPRGAGRRRAPHVADLPDLRRSGCRHRRRRRGNRGTQAARARRPRPGAVRHPPGPGGEPGAPSTPRQQAHRRPHEPHHRVRARRRRARRGTRAHARRRRGHAQGARARARDAEGRGRRPAEGRPGLSCACGGAAQFSRRQRP